jgi:hypothetical protein
MEADVDAKCWDRWLSEKPENISYLDYKDKLLSNKDLKVIDFQAIRQKSKAIERRFKADGII